MQIQYFWFCQYRILVLVHPGQTLAHLTFNTVKELKTFPLQKLDNYVRNVKTSWKTKTTDRGKKVFPKRAGYTNVCSKVKQQYPLPFKPSVQSRFSRTGAEKVFQKQDGFKSFDKELQIPNIFSDRGFSSERIFCCFAVIIYSHSFSHKQ